MSSHDAETDLLLVEMAPKGMAAAVNMRPSTDVPWKSKWSTEASNLVWNCSVASGQSRTNIGDSRSTSASREFDLNAKAAGR
ncbi:hypothetical protein H634G_08665 [Metarhizium anisopliae BRIP 53293]|uniref:Uncharacterized protein n=1 Tax=Metarhizium anisopliae BRIP 53293 TaxID=1291518 RepID=A0A0D9NQL9_METAN|nr:hypothetical protein H634G_08665 [Metarhizium anisopliae BRIP 53293]